MATDVTFDTNMWIRLVNEPMRQEHKDRLQIERVLRRVEARLINPFFCDATIWESVDRNRRKSVLNEFANPDMQVTSVSVTGQTADGEPLLTSRWEMQNQPDLTVNQHWQDDIRAALELGLLFIDSTVQKFSHMIGNMDLEPPIYKTVDVPSNQVRMDRFMDAEDELNRHGVGMNFIRTQVAQALEIAPEKVVMVQMAVLADNKVKSSVSEWVDALVVCTHYAYGHQYLCTLDEGGGAGSKSVMHTSHRQWLKDFGIEILNPKDLADKIAV